MSSELLCGKYRLLERLGQGGMAVVQAGVHVKTERAVAIKRLLPQHENDPRLTARFELEARAAGRIRSKYVLEILDIDRDEDGRPFLVMERLFGEPLSSRLRDRGRLPADEALGIVRQVLLGLIEAHGAGVIHRDLKPANIFIERDPDGSLLAKIVDFGISKVRGVDPHLEVTEQGETLGTLAYMPPEQLGGGGGEISSAVDLWAVGVILFRLLTGEMPFRGDDTMALILSILQDPPARLAATGVDARVSHALQPLLDRLLSKDPAGRFWGADEALRALDEASVSLGLAPAQATASLSLRRPAMLAPPRPSPLPRAAAGVALGAAAGWFLLGALSPSPAGLALSTSPPSASLWVGGSAVAGREQLPASMLGKPAQVAADGHRPAAFSMPSEPGAHVLVVLASEAAAPGTAPAAPQASPQASPQAASALAAATTPPAPVRAAPVAATPAANKAGSRPTPAPPSTRPPTLITSPD